MLTRIEISGFKSFTYFAVDLAPLTVIAGPNGSGKSNLFDALRLLGGLTRSNGLETISATRGGLTEAFTKIDAEDTTRRIDIAVEILLPPWYGDYYPESLLHRRFRYEIALELRESEIWGKYPEISHERLVLIDANSDNWMEKNLPLQVRKQHPIGSSSKPLIDDQPTPFAKLNRLSMLVRNPEYLARTKLSEVSSSSDIHLLAVRDTLLSLTTIDLNERAHFSNYNGTAPGSRPVESNVLKTLVQLSHSPEGLSYLSNRVKQVIPELSEIDVYTDDFRRTSITAKDKDGRRFLADSLSEGTLRVISLATLLLQPAIDTTLLIEEPENGVDPRVLDQLLRLLDDLSSGFEENEEGLRQVICTTHSPTLLQAAIALKSDGRKVSVLLANKVSAVIRDDGKSRQLNVTRLNPVLPEARQPGSTPLDRYTLNQALAYLNQLSVPGTLTKAAN